MTHIKQIDKAAKKVWFTDDTSITHEGFIKKFRTFLTNRIAGETLIPADMERFMRRTSGKSLEQLMKSKKMEGYMEGALDKVLTRRQMIALGTVVTIVFVGIFVYIVLKNQGLLPEM